MSDQNRDRDKAFTKYGWTVVRFSEQQVLSSPLNCCEIVNYIINYWTLEKTDFILDECEIEVEKRWDKDDAKRMAINKVRQFNYFKD